MKILNPNVSLSQKLEIVDCQHQKVIDDTSEIKKGDEILCQHCLRTASNGIKCQGICVADSGY